MNLNRIEDALAVYDEVGRRFGQSDFPVILESVAKALANRGFILGELNQPEDAMAAFDEVVSRFGESDVPAILEQVGIALYNKGVTLIRLNREEDALSTYSEVANRFRMTDHSVLRALAGYALVEKGELECRCEQYDTTVETVSQALDLLSAEPPEKRVRGHLVRAKATVACGDRSACERDVEVVLTLVRGLGPLPKESIDTLMFCGVALGAERMCELIEASPSAEFLLPLRTALELERGLEPRVAQEVREVAEDIRRNLAKLREAGTEGSRGEIVVSAEGVGSSQKDV